MAAELSRRLHPASLLFSLASILRRFLIPGLLVLYVGRERAELWIMILAVPAALYAVAKYISLRYSFGRSELVIREGIVQKRERLIPYDRIQNIDTTRNLAHRLFGVANVAIQTASGQRAEAELRVLSLTAVEALREQVAKRRTAQPLPTEDSRVDQASDAPVLARVGLKDLVAFGVISNRGMLALAAALGVLWQFELMPSKDQIERFFGWFTGIEQWTLGATVAVVALTVLSFVVGLRLLSIGWAIITLYDFHLSRHENEIRTRFGLLTLRTATIPRHRIQLITAEATLLHRLFSRVAVRARTAGSATSEQDGARRDWLIPILPARQLAELLPAVQPDLHWTELQWQPIHPRARWRLFVRYLVIGLVPAVGLAIHHWPWGAISLPAVIGAAALYSHLKYVQTQYALSDAAVWFTSGWFVRQWRVVRYSKIQMLRLTQTPFDRRHRMMSLKIDTANAGSGQFAIVIPFLACEVAREIYQALAQEAAAREFRW